MFENTIYIACHHFLNKGYSASLLIFHSAISEIFYWEYRKLEKFIQDDSNEASLILTILLFMYLYVQWSCCL